MVTVFTSSTLAAFTIASHASTKPTRPLVSINPIAALIRVSFGYFAGCTNDGSSSWGREITCTLTTSPILAAASAPASVAAFTAATSPSTKAVTSPEPTDCQPVNVTFADLSMASVASNRATRPFVSIIPSACFIASSLLQWCYPNFSFPARSSLCVTCSCRSYLFLLVLFDELNLVGQVQTARVGLVGVHVDVEPGRRVDANMDVIEGHARRPADAELHAVALGHAEVRGLLRTHVHVDCRSYEAFLQFDNALGSNDDGARRARDVA